jgi:hypothetical protein
MRRHLLTQFFNLPAQKENPAGLRRQGLSYLVEFIPGWRPNRRCLRQNK